MQLFVSLFTRLKKKAAKRNWDTSRLEKVIDLILENSDKSINELKRHHNMHTLSGKWAGSNECHVANAGDWLLIWKSDGKTAFFQRTGTHDELFK